MSLGVVLLEGEAPEGFKGKQKREWNDRARKKVTKLLSPSEPSAITASIQRRSKARLSELQGSDEAEQRHAALKVPSLASTTHRFPKELRVRGFTEKQIKKWNIRWVEEESFPKKDGEGTFTITNAIGIPIFNEKGKLVLWCYRATKKSPSWFQDMRYLYTPGAKDTISRTWFGLDQHGDEDHVTVTEGALDAIWLDQCGFPAIAILGSNTVEFEKLERLAAFRKVTIFTDRDNAGILAAVTIGTYLLKHGTPVRIVRYPPWGVTAEGKPAKDPNNLCPLDVELVWHRAIPFQTWQLSNRTNSN